MCDSVSVRGQRTAVSVGCFAVARVHAGIIHVGIALHRVRCHKTDRTFEPRSRAGRAFCWHNSHACLSNLRRFATLDRGSMRLFGSNRATQINLCGRGIPPLMRAIPTKRSQHSFTGRPTRSLLLAEPIQMYIHTLSYRKSLRASARSR